MPEFILFCLQTSELLDFAKKKALHVILLGLHIKILSVVYRQQHGSFPSFKCSPIPATHPDGKVLQTKAQYSEGMCEFASSHFSLQIFVLLFAFGKSVLEEHNQRFIRNAREPLFLSSFTSSFLQSKLSANTCQHLIAVTQVITRNKKYFVFLNVFCLSLYPGCCFHSKLFFTAII